MAELFATAENEEKANEIIKLYNQYLGRDPLQGGIDGWLATNQSIEQIEQGIANSPEAAVFQTFNSTIGRDPTMEERDFFVNVNPAPIENIEEVLSNTQEAQQFQTQQQLDQTDMLADTTADDTTLDDTTVGDETETAFPTADTGRFGDMIDASATFADANQYLGVNEAQWSAFVNEVNDIKAQMNAFEGNEARVLQDRSTPDALLDRRIAVLLNQNPGMTADEARAEAESGEAYQQLATTNAQYEALNERLNQAYANIGLPGAATIAGSGISGEGYRVDFNLNTGEVTYREVGGSSFLESALGIAIAAVFAGPIAGAIAGATGASAAVATAAASGIVNSATQLAMTGDLDVTQALSAAATGYLNPSASANVMSNPNVASLTQQVSDTAFNEVTGSQIIGELTNASANSGAVVDAISNAVGAAATNAIFGGDDGPDAAQQPDAIENQAAGIENDDGTTTYSVFQGALPDGYIFDQTRNVVIHQETGTEYDVDVSVYGVRVTLPNIEPQSAGGGGDTATGGDSSVDGADGADGVDAGGAESATTVTVDPSAGGVASQDDSLPEIGDWVFKDGVWNQVGGYSNELGVPTVIYSGEIITGPGSEGEVKSDEEWAVIDQDGGFRDGTYTQGVLTEGESIIQGEGTGTEQTDATKAVDWILVNLPNYEDMTEVEINQALEGAGLEPVDINNDGTVSSKSEVVTTADGDQTSTVTVGGSGAAAGAGAGAGAGSGDGAGAGSGAGSGAGVSGGGAGNGAGGAGGAGDGATGGGGGVGTVSTGGQGGGTGEGTGAGSGDGTGDGDGLDGKGMLTALAPLATMAEQQGDPFSTFDIRIQAPTIQPVQIAPLDARKELDNQLARLLNDPQSQRRQSLFGGLV